MAPRHPGQGGCATAALVLVAGWLHGAVPRLAIALRDGDGLAESGGVSPVEALTAIIAALALMRCRSAPPASWPGLLFAAILLLPGTLGAEFGMIAYALWLGWQPGPRRVPAFLFAGLAGCALWWPMVERLAGSAPLIWDAALVQGVLGPFINGFVRAGNVVGVVGGHQIVVLPACSTFNGLPVVMLGLAALSMRDGLMPRHLWRAMALLAVTYATFNLARLVALALSPALYHVGHGPAGQMAFDAVSVGLPLLLASRLRPPAPAGAPALLCPAQPRWQGALAGGLVLAAAVLMAVRVASPPPVPREKLAHAALNHFLAGQGWRLMDARMVGPQRVDLFAHAGCPAPLAVAVAPYAAQSVSSLQAVLGPQTQWLEQGEITATAPLRRHAWNELRSAALARLGVAPDRLMPILAIARGPGGGELAACELPGAAAWRDLAELPG